MNITEHSLFKTFPKKNFISVHSHSNMDKIVAVNEYH